MNIESSLFYPFSVRPVEHDPIERREYKPRLLDTCDMYLDKEDVNTIESAFDFMVDTHGKKMRKKEPLPYWVHTARVAQMCADFQLPAAMVCSGLLHDTVEDTDASYEDIENSFGSDVMGLVKGLTKISHVSREEKKKNRDKDEVQEFNRILTTMQEDPRIILLKIFDRYDNLQSLDKVDKRKSPRIAKWTKLIYVPLARRLGLTEIADDMDVICSAVSHGDKPLDYDVDEINDEILRMREDLKEYNWYQFGVEPLYIELPLLTKKAVTRRQSTDFHGIITVLDAQEQIGVYSCLAGELSTRDKIMETNPFVEMRNNEIVTFVYQDYSRVYHWDIMTIEQRLNHLASLVHLYQLPPGYGIGVDDYSNRLEKLKKAAQKNLDFVRDSFKPEKTVAEMDRALMEFAEAIETGEIWVTTPKGEIVWLPIGATVLDFAYKIHADVGHVIDEAKRITVSGRVDSLEIDSPLQSGDVLEIVKRKDEYDNDIVCVKPSWLDIVKTTYARQVIRGKLRKLKDAEKLDKPGSYMGSITEKAWSRGRRIINEHYSRLTGADVVTDLNLYRAIKKVAAIENAREFLIDVGIDGPVEKKKNAVLGELMRIRKKNLELNT